MNPVRVERHTPVIAISLPPVGERVADLRLERGLSLQAVADASGMTKTNVHDIEKGKNLNPTIRSVWGLAKALSVDPRALLEPWPPANGQRVTIRPKRPSTVSR